MHQTENFLEKMQKLFGFGVKYLLCIEDVLNVIQKGSTAKTRVRRSVKKVGRESDAVEILPSIVENDLRHVRGQTTGGAESKLITRDSLAVAVASNGDVAVASQVAENAAIVE